MWDSSPSHFGRGGRREFTKAASLPGKGSVQLGHPKAAWSNKAAGGRARANVALSVRLLISSQEETEG